MSIKILCNSGTVSIKRYCQPVISLTQPLLVEPQLQFVKTITRMDHKVQRGARTATNRIPRVLAALCLHQYAIPELAVELVHS